MAVGSNSDADQVFDLKKYLPPVEEEEKQLIAYLDNLSKQILGLVRQKQLPSEQDQVAILELIPSVESSPTSSAILGFVLMTLHQFEAMRELYKRQIELVGEVIPFIYYLALAERKLGNKEKSLHLLQRIIKLGERNYWVFMEAAELQHELGDHSESVAMCNLAIYENKHESPEPFVLLSRNFLATSNMSKMFECFSRVEKIGGQEALVAMGEMYENHKDMYESLGNILRNQGE